MITNKIISESERKNLAILVTRLFAKWGLSADQKLKLLGLSPKSRASLTRYKTGSPLPPMRDVIDRVGWLLGIHKALRVLYPRNEDIRYSWVCRRNGVFDNLRPIDVMLEQGLVGIIRVSQYLQNYKNS